MKRLTKCFTLLWNRDWSIWYSTKS